MLTIRVTGANLRTARQCLGWSLQEAAARSAVNCLTIKKYEGAGEPAAATVCILSRLVDALEDAGVRLIGLPLLADSRKTKQKLQPKPKKC